jgi:hypothetical protein
MPSAWDLTLSGTSPMKSTRENKIRRSRHAHLRGTALDGPRILRTVSADVDQHIPKVAWIEKATARRKPR